ncbi:hypothetical protein QE152_g9075 [Popillia japonica]|uniref:Uncharacterized protein n=1 Tax=Popillia japonica TaxID=7064 RepID=A0AAW1M100_POPJA
MLKTAICSYKQRAFRQTANSPCIRNPSQDKGESNCNTVAGEKPKKQTANSPCIRNPSQDKGESNCNTVAGEKPKKKKDTKRR